jgi:cell wall-associated NlpC family hydrolase
MASHRAPKTSTRAATYTAVGLAAGTVALLPSASEAAPAQSLDQVKSEVNTLYTESEAATQKYDAAQQQYAQLQQKVTSLQGQIVTETGTLAALQKAMGLQAGVQYQQNGLSPALELAMTANPDAFLTQASAADEAGTQDASRLKQLNAAEVTLRQDQATAASLMSQQQTELAQLAANKSTIQSELNKAQNLLSSLSASQLAQVEGNSGSTSYSGTLPPVSGRAGVAVAYAESKVGDRYVYAQTGPSEFDCSGLVYAAWRAAGVSIERDSMEQWASLPHISRSELEPGDLVFYYPGPSGPGHVAMYIGNNEIVQALNPNAGILYSPMIGQMPLVGFARVV